MKPFEKPIYVTRPLRPNPAKLQKEMEEIWESQILTNGGAKHQKLERCVREFLKVPHCSLFNNGTIALLVACQALELKGEVITTPFTFPATAHSLTWSGLKPVFCDVDPVTLNLDPAHIEPLITEATSAILPVHVYGTPCDVRGIQKIADRYGLKVIYDAAHAFGTEIDGKGIGTFGDMTMFSFHATKLFHTVEGGCLICQDESTKVLIDRLKNFGIKNENEVLFPGINGKMNEIQAAIGLVNLCEIEPEWKRRSRIAEVYSEELGDIPGITLLNEKGVSQDSFQYFVIRIDAEQFGLSRDELHQRLKEWNVITRKYFFPLCSNYPCYRDLPSAHPSRLPVANKIVNEVLSLPLYGELDLDDVRRICRMIGSLALATQALSPLL